MLPNEKEVNLFKQQNKLKEKYMYLKIQQKFRKLYYLPVFPPLGSLESCMAYFPDFFHTLPLTLLKKIQLNRV